MQLTYWNQIITLTTKNHKQESKEMKGLEKITQNIYIGSISNEI